MVLMVNRAIVVSVVWISVFLFLQSSPVSCQSTTTTTTTAATNATTTTTTTTTTIATTTTTTTTTVAAVTTSSNNALWMIIGICGGIFFVVVVVIVVAICYSCKKKKVHPHSDTDSICSSYDSSLPQPSRPTTASHIYFDTDDEEEAMSKPVVMTPFELRKLYVETFPYSTWKKGFDGSLRPSMTLKFVEPGTYKQTKGDEQAFRDKILNYEMSDSLTLRSAAASRMAKRPPTSFSKLEPVQEKHENPSPGHGRDSVESPQKHSPNGADRFDDAHL